MVISSIIGGINNFFSPNLKIHCWGGLGSQLQAVAYYLKAEKLYPDRTFQLVLHSSGITERRSEIGILRDRVKIEEILDFNHSNTPAKNSYKFFNSINRYSIEIVKRILDKLRIIIYTEQKVYKLKPWTRELRCSYSNTNLEIIDIRYLAKLLNLDSYRALPKVIGVHFRSGDLQTLKPASYIPKEVMVRIINERNLRHDFSRVEIYSDSLLKESDFNSINQTEISIKILDTLKTIDELMDSGCFIGTNSKVSLWVALFRYSFDIPGEIVVPQSIYDLFKKCLRAVEPRENFTITTFNT